MADKMTDEVAKSGENECGGAGAGSVSGDTGEGSDAPSQAALVEKEDEIMGDEGKDGTKVDDGVGHENDANVVGGSLAGENLFSSTADMARPVPTFDKVSGCAIFCSIHSTFNFRTWQPMMMQPRHP